MFSTSQNIREGYKKGTIGEFIHSIKISLGSLEELSGDCEDSKEDKLMTEREFDKFSELFQSATYMAGQYIKSLYKMEKEGTWRTPGDRLRKKATFRNVPKHSETLSNLRMLGRPTKKEDKMNTNKTLFKVFLISAAVFLCLSATLYAAVPAKINYQGKLKESGALVTATKNMNFKIYDALTAGNLLWESGAGSGATVPVSVTNGLFTYVLGNSTTDASDLSGIDWENKTCYLEVTVAGIALSPRELLIAVPYALSVRALDIDADGNVGIGLTNPLEKLQISGNLRLSNNLTDGTNSLTVANAKTAYDDRLKWDGGSTGLTPATGRTSLGLGSLATLSTITNSELTSGSFSNITGVGTLGSLSVSGNVGIGTTSPGANLHIYNSGTAGTLRTLLKLETADSTTGTGASIDFAEAGTVTGRISKVFEAAGVMGLAFSPYNGGLAEKVRITGAGNVGIGTTEPTSRLTVYYPSNAPSLTDATKAGFNFWGGTLVRLLMGTDANSPYGVWMQATNLSSAWPINLNPLGGSVGIGTTAPGALLDLGLAGTTLGVVRLAGSTSGNVSLQPNAVAGTGIVLTLPATTGTLVTGGGTASGTNTGDNAANSSTMYIGTTAVALNRASAALILTGITSIDGNAATVTTNANLTGDVTSAGNATTLTNAPVIAKVLTGYTSGAGTVAATDSILQAIQKLNGNDATNANLTGPITSTGNTTSVAVQTGTGSTFVMNTSPTIITPVFTTSISTPSIITASGALGITPAAGSNLNITLGTTGDLAVNTSQLYVDTSAGKVGIGTTGPLGKLDIAGGADNSGAGDQYDIALQYRTGGYRHRITSRHNSGAATGNDIDFYLWNYGVDAVGAIGTKHVMTLEGTGNVGIGTTAPTAVLHLKAGTATANTAPLKFTSGTNLTTAEAGAMEWNGTNLSITQTAGPTRKILSYTDHTHTYPVTSVFSRTGAVTAAANDYTWAQIDKTTSSLADITTRSAGALNSGNLGIALMPTGGNWDLTSNLTIETDALAVDYANKRVGIGTTSPQELFQVSKISNNAEVSAILGNAATHDYTNSVTSLKFKHRDVGGGVLASAGKILSGREGIYNYTADRDSFMAFYTAVNDADTEKMRITSAGNVTGIYGDYHVSSDIRRKKDIVTIPNALDKVLALRGVNFKWKDPSQDDNLHMGMIAQEVEKVVPEVVHTADDEMRTKAVEYQYMVGLLVEAIKEQQKGIDELKEKVKLLEAKLNAGQ